jgi:hypothetical protein
VTGLVIALLAVGVLVLVLLSAHLDGNAADERASNAALRRELSRYRHPSQSDDDQ